MVSKTLTINKQSILYGLTLAVLLIALKLTEWHFIVLKQSFELYAGAIAILFTGLGVWLTLKLRKPPVNSIFVEAQVYPESSFIPNDSEIRKLRISNRELEVLQLMAVGLSNQEIAERLFVSLNTVKTHSSNLFEKLQVARRTQAVNKARRLNLLP